MNDTEDIKMLVSPQPYVDPFYNKLNKEKDEAHLRTPCRIRRNAARPLS